MKTLIKAAIFLLGTTVSLVALAASCNVPNDMEPALRDNLERKGGIPVSKEQCAILYRTKLYVSVVTMHGVMGGVSYGWASATLVNENDVRSSVVSKATRVDSGQPDTPTSEVMEYEAVAAAIKGLNFEKAAHEVLTKEKKILGSGKLAAGT